MVWGAHDLTVDRRVALKFLRAGTFTEAAKKRFFREARASMAVQHPNVVRVHELLTAPDGSPVMVMDFLDGESLGERLEKRHKLSLRETADLMGPVVSAIGSAHAKGIVHRDLKPDNIFLCSSATGDEPRVLDFGIAKLTAKDGEAMATAGLTSTGAVLGTPYYMSPEQVFADKSIDQRADVWSLGVIIYECLSGKKPLVGDSIGALLRAISMGDRVPLRVLQPELPSDVLELCDAMISVDREKRPHDLRAVCEVLAKYSSKAIIPFGEATMDASIPLDETMPAEPMSLQSTNDGMVQSAVQTPARRTPWIVAAAAIFLVGGVGGGVVLLRNPTTAPTVTASQAPGNAAPPPSAAIADPAPSPSVASPPAPSPSASSAPLPSTRVRPQQGPSKPTPSAVAPPQPSTVPTQPIVRPGVPGVASNNPYK